MTQVGPVAHDAPVVFVAEFMPTFELVIPVWNALRERGVPTMVVATPRRATPPGEKPSPEHYHYDTARELWNWLEAEGFDPLPQLPPDQEADRLRSLQPGAVFLSSPYDNLHHPSLAPQELGLPVHYVSYLFRIGPDEFHAETTLPFYDYLDTVYAETPFERDLYLSSGLDPDKVVLAGHPGLDVWDQPHELAPAPTVLWCPWWSYEWIDGRRGYCTFLEGRRAMLDEARRRPGLQVQFRPHGNLFHSLRSAQLWTPDEEAEFWAEVESLPNVSVHVAGEVSHVEQLGRAWGMVTDGISFFCEFSYTGKPLLLTQAPGNPGWNEVGQQIEALVDTSHVMDSLPDFLDRLEAGLDPQEVAQRQEQMRAILGRSPRGAAAAVADHVVNRRNAVIAARALVIGADPEVLTEQQLAEVERLNAFDGDESSGVGRCYQRELLSVGRINWCGRRLAMTSMPIPSTGNSSFILTSTGDNPIALITRSASSGWEIERVIVGDAVFAAVGDDAGVKQGSVEECFGPGTSRRLRRLQSRPATGARTVWLGTSTVTHDLWNQLPALVHWEYMVGELAAVGQARVWHDPQREAQRHVLGSVHELLPALADHVNVMRSVPPARTIPVGSVRVSAEARRRVVESLRHVRVPAPQGQRLWMSLEGAVAPVNLFDAVGAIAAEWCRVTGGEVVIDSFCPDDAQRNQEWMTARIADADLSRESAAARAYAHGAPAGRVLTTTSLSLRESLAMAGQSRAQVSCSGEGLRRAAWVWRLPGVVITGPAAGRDAVASWYGAHVDGGVRLEVIDASLLATAEGGWAIANVAEAAVAVVAAIIALTENVSPADINRTDESEST